MIRCKPPESPTVCAKRAMCFSLSLLHLCIHTISFFTVDERFPAFQLSVAGLALCLDPSLLAFVRLVSLKDYQAPFGYEVPLEDASSPKTARRGAAGIP